MRGVRPIGGDLINVDIPQLLPGAGLASLVTATLWLIFTGRLVPKSVVDQVTVLAAKEAEMWRTAFDKSEAARLEERRLVDKAIESAQATANVVRAFTEVTRALEKQETRND